MARIRKPPTGGKLHKEKNDEKSFCIRLWALTGAMLVAPAAFCADHLRLQPEETKLGGDFPRRSAWPSRRSEAGGLGAVARSGPAGMRRNGAQIPGASGAIRAAMILGLVFIETLALFDARDHFSRRF